MGWTQEQDDIKIGYRRGGRHSPQHQSGIKYGSSPPIIAILSRYTFHEHPQSTSESILTRLRVTNSKKYPPNQVRSNFCLSVLFTFDRKTRQKYLQLLPEVNAMNYGPFRNNLYCIKENKM